MTTRTRSDRRPRGGRSAHRRRAIRLVASSAAATVAVIAIGLAAWWAPDAWRVGRVVLINDGRPLTVQVLDESDDGPIGEPIELIRRRTLALPSGEYRIRVEGEGELSRTYRLGVNRGETFTQALTLNDNRLLGERPMPQADGSAPPRKDPVPFNAGIHSFERTPGRSDFVEIAVELTPGSSDFVEMSARIVRCRDGRTGELIWDALAPSEPGKPPRRDHPWLLWLAGNHGNGVKPIEPAFDVDGDGTRDPICAAESFFVALSGKDGSVLWTYGAELDGPGGAYPEGPLLPGPIRPAIRPAQLVAEPATADVDHDGVPDIIATIVFHEFRSETARRRPELYADDATLARVQFYRRVVVAVSGRTGRWLWNHAVDPVFGPISNEAWSRPAVAVDGRQTHAVGVLDGTRWIGLVPDHGFPRLGAIELGIVPARPLQYADLDGDGEPDILALGNRAGATTLSAFSIAKGAKRWGATINARYAHPFDDTVAPDWPIVADLDGDGRSEIAVPDQGRLDPTNHYRGVCLLDGATGLPRWTRPMRPATRGGDGLFEIIEAPDLDRDGVRDLVTTSFFLGRNPVNANLGGPGDSERVYVDALSGKDGRPLWWWYADRPSDAFTYVPAPRWWGRGPDGRPLLAIGTVPEHPTMWPRTTLPSAADRATVTMLSASTGRVVHTLPGFWRMNVADLDGDGLLDLWGAARMGFHDDLRAFRGEPPEAWRALGSFDAARDPMANYGLGQEVRPAADLDGDGIGDTLIAGVRAPGATPSLATGSRTAIARSGRDGHLLWKADLGLRRGWFEPDRGEVYSLTCFPLPAGDLDGDGTPDVIVREQTQQPPARMLGRHATLPLLVLSGRTGRPIWLAGPLPTSFEAHGYSTVLWAVPQAVKPGARPDLIVRHDSPFLAASPTPPMPNSLRRDHLARVDGRSGRVLWDVALSDLPSPQGAGVNLPPPIFRDLDGDTTLDLLHLVQSTAGGPKSGFDLQAVSLRDGRMLWSESFEVVNFWSPPQAMGIDLSDPTRTAVAVMSTSTSSGDSSTVRVRALDSRDGKTLWLWKQDGVSRNGPGMVTARLEADRKRRVCISFTAADGSQWLVLLDPGGRETLRQKFPPDRSKVYAPGVVDLDGDGRDELLIWQGGRLRAWDGRLAEIWSRPEDSSRLASIIPASGGRESTLLLASGLALDGKTGRPLWLGPREHVWPFAPGMLLDPGDSARRPLSIQRGEGLTIARSAMPATPDGRPSPTAGDPVPPGAAVGDPRWTRPLPWTIPILYTIGLQGFVSSIELALVNVAVPLLIVWLAARRRPWTLRLLMALPLAAAIPLSVFQTVEPLIPGQIGSRALSSKAVFIIATMAGTPIVALAAAIVRDLLRRRWKALLLIVGLTVAASAVIAGVWIGIDSRTMPAIEHYGRSDWPLALVPGAHAAGVLLILGWFVRGLYRGIGGLGRRRPRGAAEAVPARATP